MFSSGEASQDARATLWEGGRLVDDWTKTMEAMQKKAAEKLQKKAAEVQAATSALFALPNASPSELDPEVVSSSSTLDTDVADAGGSAANSVDGSSFKAPNFSALPAGPAVPLGGGTPAMHSMSPSTLASQGSCSKNRSLNSSEKGSSSTSCASIDGFHGSTDASYAGNCELSLNTGASDSASTRQPHSIEADLKQLVQPNKPHKDIPPVLDTLPDLWMRPLPLPLSPTQPATLSTTQRVSQQPLDGKESPSSHRDGDSSVCGSSSDGGMCAEGEETHERLLKLALRTGAKLSQMMRRIDRAAREHDFPLPKVQQHPFSRDTDAVFSPEESPASGDRNSGRLRDAVREAAAKGLNLLITPTGTPKSAAPWSPEGHASGPDSSPAESEDSNHSTPVKPSPPGVHETWSEILNPVKTSLEAKVSSLRQSAFTDLGKVVQKLPPEARESANSVLGILGTGTASKFGACSRQTVVTREGHVFEGEVNEDGQMHRDGYGRLTWPDGHWFQGKFVAGETCGLGRRAWPTGHAFSGMENKGSKHGLGIYTWPDSRRYEGEFKFDVKDGIGFMHWPNARCYLGEWKRGLQDGDGIEWRSEGCFLTVYEAGRLVCDQLAPPALQERLAAISNAASIVPVPASTPKREGATTRAAGAESESFAVNATSPHSRCDGVNDSVAAGNCHARDSPLKLVVSESHDPFSEVESGKHSANDASGVVRQPSSGGRRRGPARQIARHVSATEDGMVPTSCERETHEGESSKASKAGWNLKVINGEIVAMRDAMSLSSPSTPQYGAGSRNEDAIPLLDQADLINSGSASKGPKEGRGVRRSLMNTMMGGKGSSLPGLPDNFITRDLDAHGEHDGEYSAGSSSFDASPASRSSSSSDSSGSWSQRGIRKMIDFTGQGKMESIVELFQGGKVSDMVEGDSDAGLAERLAEQSDLQVAREAQGPASGGSRNSSGPKSPGSKPHSPDQKSRRGLAEMPQEIADAQFPSVLVKSVNKTSRASSRSSCTTPTSQASATSSTHEDKSLSKLPSPSHNSLHKIAGKATAISPAQEAAEFIEDEESLALVATKKLWDASAAGDTHLVSLTEALGGGARVDWLDAEDRGNTALHKAAQVGALELVRALLMAKGCWGRGAAPSSRNAFNDTPLHAAAFKGHAAVADVLIEAQADVNARSDDGESPLHMAAFGGHAQVCEVLVRGGAQVDAIALREGDTPLHLAALGRHVVVVEVLLEAGARTDVRNKDDFTAVELANIQQYEDVIEILQNKSTNEKGPTSSSLTSMDPRGLVRPKPGNPAALARIVSGDLGVEGARPQLTGQTHALGAQV